MYKQPPLEFSKQIWVLSRRNATLHNVVKFMVNCVASCKKLMHLLILASCFFIVTFLTSDYLRLSFHVMGSNWPLYCAVSTFLHFSVVRVLLFLLPFRCLGRCYNLGAYSYYPEIQVMILDRFELEDICIPC